MKIDFRTFFLKSLPYLLSIAGGVVLYTGAIDNSPNANVRDLVINVSASLLSIPLVFLLYDYTNNRIANQMKKNLLNSMTDKLNILMVNIIMVLRAGMSVRTKLTVENLNRMLMWRASDISPRLQITPHLLELLHTYHNDLDTLLYRGAQTGALDSEQIHILSALARDMAHLINENKFRRSRTMSAKYVANIMSHILDWLDSDSVAALHLQQHLSDEISTKKEKK